MPRPCCVFCCPRSAWLTPKPPAGTHLLLGRLATSFDGGLVHSVGDFPVKSIRIYCYCGDSLRIEVYFFFCVTLKVSGYSSDRFINYFSLLESLHPMEFKWLIKWPRPLV